MTAQDRSVEHEPLEQGRSSTDLSGRVGIVTGASRGIGEGIARCLALAGAHVIVTSRATADLELVCHTIRTHGGEVSALELDVTDHRQTAGLATQMADLVGPRCDFLVNNAGVMATGPLMEISEESWAKNIDTNLKGTLFCTQAVLPLLVESDGGRVVNISSIHGLIGRAERSVYGASKGGINSLTRHLAVELGPRAITVNAICPGVVPTRMGVRRLDSPEQRSDLAESIPLRRLGTPEDVGSLASFLCSPAASYITGQVIAVDGGWSVT